MIEINGVETINDITVHRITNTSNGTGRYVVHWLAIAGTYIQALINAKTIGGKKYHRKSFGGGIVFTSSSVDELVQYINKVKE